MVMRQRKSLVPELVPLSVSVCPTVCTTNGAVTKDQVVHKLSYKYNKNLFTSPKQIAITYNKLTKEGDATLRVFEAKPEGPLSYSTRDFYTQDFTMTREEMALLYAFLTELAGDVFPVVELPK